MRSTRESPDPTCQASYTQEYVIFCFDSCRIDTCYSSSRLWSEANEICITAIVTLHPYVADSSHGHARRHALSGTLIMVTRLISHINHLHVGSHCWPSTTTATTKPSILQLHTRVQTDLNTPISNDQPHVLKLR